MCKFVNLTPHEVNINGVSFPPSGQIARAAEKRKLSHYVSDNIPVNRVLLGDISGVPAPQEGTYYIVSRIVAEAMRFRNDLLVPDDLIRDNSGRVIGAKAFACFYKEEE
jgi:hypothetical protein